jgi:hypothetical protein
MVTDQLLLGLVIGSLLYSLAFLFGRQWAAPRDSRRDEQAVDTDSETLRCPNCETKNERGYRFCRSCLDELPGSRQFTKHSQGSYGRLMR